VPVFSILPPRMRGYALAMVVGLELGAQGQVTNSYRLPNIAAGQSYTVGLASGGRLVVTGDNSRGQGDLATWSNIVTVSAGVWHTVGLRADGTALATGNNFSGQTNVWGWSDIVAVAAGYDHTVGLKSDGTVLATGDNSTGECNVSQWTNVRAIAAGYDYTIGLKVDGTLVATGENQHGQCNVTNWNNIVAVSAGAAHTVVLKVDGTLVATGANYYGECNVAGFSNVAAIMAGGFHTLGLKSNGTVAAVGGNFSGQTEVADWSNVVAVAGGVYHSVGLKTDHTVVAAGAYNNNSGQTDVWEWYLGADAVRPIITQPPIGEVAIVGGSARLEVRAARANSYQWRKNGSDLVDGAGITGAKTRVLAIANVQPQHGGDYSVAVANFSGATTSDIVRLETVKMPSHTVPRIAAGALHTVGLKTDGTLLVAGNNTYGETNVGGWSNIVAVAAGYGFTTGLKHDGTVLGAGWTNTGSLNLSGWSGIVDIAAGAHHTVGLKASGGAIVASGDFNISKVSAWTDLIGIAAGHYNTWGMKSDGTVLGTGSCGTGVNDFGQCNVSDWTNIISLAGGYHHLAGLRSDGAVLMAGTNLYAQMGVAGWSNIIAIASGEYHIVGLKTDGTVLAIGQNSSGQCNVSGWSNIVMLGAGEAHTVGLKADGTVVAAGANNQGQLNVFGWYLKDDPVPPIITVPPTSNQLGYIEGNVTLRVVAAGPGPMSYQWRKDGLQLLDGSRVSGARSTTLNLFNLQMSDAGAYTVLVTNRYGATTSGIARLEIDYPPAISVGAAGSGVMTFDTVPVASDWSTRSLPGGADMIVGVAQLDGVVQGIEAASITNELAVRLSFPPPTGSLAQWNSPGSFLATRPAGVSLVLLMATLRNDSGSALSSLRISYNLAKVAGETSVGELPVIGHGVYFSLSGMPGTWQFIPGLSQVETGLLSATFELGHWPANGRMYLLWADDNSAATDPAYTIDDFVVGEGLRLTILPRSSSEAELAWPFPSRDYELQFSTQPNASAWQTVTNADTPSGGYHRVVLHMTNGAGFYRLKKR